jgi:putative peptide zinc metalloprotease protein
MTEARTPTVPLPARHPGVVFGPVVANGWRRQHLIGAPSTGTLVGLGDREHRVLELLDGRRTTDDIRADVEPRFGVPLSEAGLYRLVGMLAAKGLIEVGPLHGDAGRPDGIGDDPPAAPPKRRNTLFRAERALVDPNRFLDAVRPLTRLLFHRAVVAGCAVVVAAALVLMVADLPVIIEQAQSLRRQPAQFIPVVVVLLASLALHELAHAAACRHWGGTVRALGVKWRLPVFIAYADVPDHALFRPVYQRVATCLAGVWSSLLVLVPVSALWGIASAAGWSWLPALASIQLAMVASVLINLVPLFGLDGYQVLSHVLGVTNLGAHGTTTVTRLFTRAGRAELAAAPRALVVTYAVYGLFSLLAGLAMAAAVVWWLHWLAGALIGPAAGIAVIAVMPVVMVTGAVLWLRRRRGGAAAKVSESR